MLRAARPPVLESDVSLFGIGFMMLVAGALLWLQFPRQPQVLSTMRSTLCPSKREHSETLSQEVLEQLPQHYGASPQDIQQLLGAPLCELPRLAVRADVLTERSIYELEDGQKVVVAYEDGGFVGHSIEHEQIPPEIVVQRSWNVQQGDTIAGYAVVASLGDLSVKMRGPVQAPEGGQVSNQVTWVAETSTDSLAKDCVVYASPQFPTYLSQLCGVQQAKHGQVKEGQTIAQIHGMLHFSLLTRRPNAEQTSEWHYVAPSPGFLEAFLGA
jgi:hypothetical protein